MGGDPAAPSAPESTASMLQAYTTYLPALLQATASQVKPVEQAQLEASQAVSPGYAALQQALYQAYGPLLARTASDIEGQNMRQQAVNTANVLAGPGRDVIQAGVEASKLADPEYYAARQAAGGALSGLLQPNLSGGERSEIERSLNQLNQSRGTAEAPTATNTVAAASTYGNALRDRLAQGLNLASGVMPALRSNVDPFAQATGRTGTVVTGQPTIAAPQQTGSTTFGTGNNFLNNIAQTQQTGMNINANRRDTLDRFSQMWNTVSPSNTVGGIGCCWIFLESYNGKLPWYIRLSRDYYYKKNPRLSIGYKRMSSWLVPLMKKNKLFRWLTNYLMIKPMSKYGRWKWTREIKYPFACNIIRLFWFNIWKLTSKI